MKIYRYLLICAVAVLITGCMSDTPSGFIKQWADCVNRKDIDCIVKNSSDHLIEINGGLLVYKQRWPYTFDHHSKMTYDILGVEQTTDSTAELKVKQTHYFLESGRDPYLEDFIYTLKKDAGGKWKLDSVKPTKFEN